MYIIDKDLDTAEILSILQDFQTHELPRLSRYENYYMGKQDILSKTYADKSKPCNTAVINFCKDIVDNYQGYLTGKPVTYSLVDGDITPIQDVLNYNDVETEDSELLKQMLIYGVGYEINWIDKDGKQRFGVLDSKECVPVYYNDLDGDLAAVIRFYKMENIGPQQDRYYVDVYTATSIFHYVSNSGWSSLNLIKMENHFYGDVPIIVAYLNSDKTSVFDQIMGMQDTYNKLINAEVDDYEAFVDAYVVFKGVPIQQVEEIAPMMRSMRVIALEDSGAEVSYLTKQFADTQIVDILDNLEKKIRTVSHSPDFSADDFGVASGIALQHKLLGFENASAAISDNLKKALQRRIELICAIATLLEGQEMWRDVQITISNNLPIDVTELTTEINGLRGLVSDKTLLTQVPFVQDVDAEYDAIQQQKKDTMNIYDFGDDDDDAETES